MTSGRKAKKTVYEKQVVFWANEYADKARAEREEVVNKARDLVAGPAKYQKPITYAAAKYVKKRAYNPETGEILEGTFHGPGLGPDRQRRAI